MGACCSSERYLGENASEREAGIKTLKMKKKERKRQLIEALAAEAKTNELLARIPGRMCRNGGSRSVCIFTQQGRKGTNQDAMVAWEDYTGRTDMVFCGVFDGHGPYGHLVARRVRDSLPSKLASIWKAKMRGDNALLQEAPAHELDMDLKWANSQEFATTDKASEGEKTIRHSQEGQAQKEEDDDAAVGMCEKWREAFVEAYEAMDTDLRRHPSIDCFCSGTTAVTLLKQGEDLVIGNVGDSRAVLATLSAEDTLEAVQLTVDLKPSLPKEAERILKCKGRVFALEDEPEVARVWLPYDDAPGLAMARAFGDFCLKDFGLISVPEVTHRKLTPHDQFLVLATDGIWDVLSNKEVVDVIHGAPTRATAARSLVETAVRAWRLKYPNSKVDDCAVVCLFLHPPTVKGVPDSDAQRHGEQKASADSCAHSQDKAEEHDHHDEPAEDASFSRSNTVRAANGGVLLNSQTEQKQTNGSEQGEQTGPPAAERSHSVRSIGDCLSTADEDEWSALEGVVRVNSLLNLPRFLKGDKRGRFKQEGHLRRRLQIFCP